MNQLTLVIYLADILPSLSIMLAILSVCGLCAAGIITICFLARNSDYDLRRRPNWVPHVYTWWRWAAPLIFVMIFCSILIPGRQTILLMAGSQFGQQIVETPQAKELLDGINKVIQQQIDDYTKKETK
jgi:hypothetical protein